MRTRLLVLLPLALAACGADVRSFDAVSADFDNPSGRIDSQSAPVLFSRAIDAQGADASTSNPWVDGMALGLTELGQAVATRRSALVVDGCDVQERSWGLLIECDGSHGVSGTLRMEGEGAEDGGEFWFRFESWCDEATDACIDGTLAFRMTLSGLASMDQRTELISTARLDLTQAGETVSVDWAIRMITTRDSASVEWLVYADQEAGAESWVLSAEAWPEGGTLEVRGSNGSFTCEYAPLGTSGTCTGPDGSFSWDGQG